MSLSQTHLRWRTVADWNAKPAIIPKWRMQHALNDALRQATDEQKIKFALLAQGDPHVWVSNSVGLQPNGAGTHRRHATKTGLAAAFAPLAEALERITAAAANPDARVDARLVADHEDVADALAVLYRTKRPDALVDQVTRHADVLDRLLDRPMTDSDRRRLEPVAVGQCAQAGMLAFMSTDYATARRHFALARSLAHDSGDATLRAQALATASTVDSPLPTCGHRGDSDRAVKLLQEAVYHDGAHAWMHCWLANELAFAHDERGFFQAVEAAKRLSERAGHTDGRGFFAGFVSGVPAVVSAKIGVGLVLLGRADEGVDLLRPGLALPWPRVQVVLLGYHATARVLQDEPEQTCADLHRALDLTTTAGYNPGRRARPRRPRPVPRPVGRPVLRAQTRPAPPPRHLTAYRQGTSGRLPDPLPCVASQVTTSTGPGSRPSSSSSPLRKPARMGSTSSMRCARPSGATRA